MEQLLIAIAAWCSVNTASSNGFGGVSIRDLFNRKLACQKSVLTCVEKYGSLNWQKRIECFLTVKEQ